MEIKLAGTFNAFGKEWDLSHPADLLEKVKKGAQTSVDHMRSGNFVFKRSARIIFF